MCRALVSLHDQMSHLQDLTILTAASPVCSCKSSAGKRHGTELKSTAYEWCGVLSIWLEGGTIINKPLSQKPDVAEAP